MAAAAQQAGQTDHRRAGGEAPAVRPESGVFVGEGKGDQAGWGQGGRGAGGGGK